MGFLMLYSNVGKKFFVYELRYLLRNAKLLHREKKFKRLIFPQYGFL